MAHSQAQVALSAYNLESMEKQKLKRMQNTQNGFKSFCSLLDSSCVIKIFIKIMEELREKTFFCENISMNFIQIEVKRKNSEKL